MRYEQISLKDSYHVADVSLHSDVALRQVTPFHPAPAAPDVPVGVGRLIVASYVGIVVAFAIGFGGDRDTNFALTIVAFFVAIYLTIPRIFLAVESKTSRRPSLDQFLSEGMMTCTGWTGGKAALVQILIVPACLIIAAIAMSVIAQLVM
jgi:hypothetical protein